MSYLNSQSLAASSSLRPSALALSSFAVGVKYWPRISFFSISGEVATCDRIRQILLSLAQSFTYIERRERTLKRSFGKDIGNVPQKVAKRSIHLLEVSLQLGLHESYECGLIPACSRAMEYRDEQNWRI